MYFHRWHHISKNKTEHQDQMEKILPFSEVFKNYIFIHGFKRLAYNSLVLNLVFCPTYKTKTEIKSFS